MLLRRGAACGSTDGKTLHLLLPFLLLLFALVATGFGPPALVPRGDGSPRVTGDIVARVRDAAPPSLSARSYLLADDLTGQVLLARDERRRVAPASTVKMMTALVARETLPLERRVKIAVDAADLGDASVMGLKRGDELAVEDLLYGLLLSSGADAALQLAIAASGSEARFVERMNARAGELGLRDTVFRNVSGLDHPEQVSTAADLATLARALLRDRVLARVVATRAHTARGNHVYTLRNTNDLLGIRPDADGVKTGTTELAGQLLVGSATQGERRAIVAVLQSDNRFVEASRLLDVYFRGHASFRPTFPPSPFHAGPDGRPWRLPEQPVATIPTWERRVMLAEVATDPTGARPPRVRFTVGDRVVAEAEAVP